MPVTGGSGNPGAAQQDGAILADQGRPGPPLFPPAPHSVVSAGKYVTGRFSSLFASTDLLGVTRPFHYRVPRLVKLLRLKEWQTFIFGNEEWAFFCAMYRIGVISIIEFQAVHNADGERFCARRIFPWRGIRHPMAIPSGFNKTMVSCGNNDFSMSFEYCIDVQSEIRPGKEATQSGERKDTGTIRITVVSAARKDCPAFSGSFLVGCNTSLSIPNVLCIPLGLNRALYGARLLMPLEGGFSVPGREVRLGGHDAFCYFDDSKGYFPWLQHNDRITGFGIDAAGRRVGFSFVDGHSRSEEERNENAVWIDGELFPIPPVRITQPNGPRKEWIIQDMEGLVDLAFTPTVYTGLTIRAIAIEVDYHRPFGTFSGTIRTGTGDGFMAGSLRGMGENRFLQI